MLWRSYGTRESFAFIIFKPECVLQIFHKKIMTRKLKVLKRSLVECMFVQTTSLIIYLCASTLKYREKT